MDVVRRMLMELKEFLNKAISFRQKLLDEAFFNACTQGKLFQIHKLLKKGANINAKKDGSSAIVCAVMNGRSDIAMLLAQNPKTDINAEDSKGETVLCTAVRLENVPVVRTILSREDVDVSKKPKSDTKSLLHKAVLSDNYALVHLLGRHPETDVNAQDEYGKTALHYASKMKNDDIFRFLLFHPKTDVNVRDNEGKTPLYDVAEKGKHTYVHMFLLHPDIKPNIQDREGNTPLHIATLLGHENVVQVLGLNPKVDLEVKNNIGRTAEQSTPFYETRKNFLLINRLRKSPNETFPQKSLPYHKRLEKKQTSRE